MAAKNELVKPFLKWAGGKRQLQEVLRANLPSQWDRNLKSYFEPFIGGGAMLFDLQPPQATISDRNPQLINCYEVIRDAVDELIEELKQHSNEESYYYNIRDWDRNDILSTKNKIESASRIIFLNKTCYNGLFRVNAAGQFNVPFGRYKNPNIVDISGLKAVSEYLQTNKVSILNQDFQEAVNNAESGDFIYFDPPYDPVSSTASFTSYYVDKFDKDEQKRLKETVDDLSHRGCHILLSNAYTDFIRDLYRDYEQVKVSATRSINSIATKRGKVEEILIKNY
jgi:DNA adenine methylase